MAGSPGGFMSPMEESPLGHIHGENGLVAFVLKSVPQSFKRLPRDLLLVKR